MIKIYVDADGCPVKQEIYKVAKRYELPVTLVANAWMRTPGENWLELVVVGDLFDAADDWIVEQVGEHDIVVCTDIPLAARCLEKGAAVLSPRGRIFTEDDIGEAVGIRDLLDHIRGTGENTGGPPPFEQRDRSRFLERLDQVVHAVRKKVRRSQAKSDDS